MDLPAFEMQCVIGHPPHPYGDLRDGAIHDPFQPAAIGYGEGSFIRRGFRHARAESVEPRLDNDQVIAFHPEGVINGPSIDGVGEREHKRFTLLDPGAEHDAPGTAVDDFQREGERPQQKPDTPRTGYYQAYNPSMGHLFKMRATLQAAVKENCRKGRDRAVFLNKKPLQK
jgi:hypothetical protein